MSTRSITFRKLWDKLAPSYDKRNERWRDKVLCDVIVPAPCLMHVV